MINVTATEELFLQRNAAIQFFRSDKDAVGFYRLISQESIYPAMLMLVNEFSNLSWTVMNNMLGIDFYAANSKLPSFKIEQILDYRLDDCLAELSNIPGLEAFEGNYLISDILSFNRVAGTYAVEKQEDLFTNISYVLANDRLGFIEFLKDYTEEDFAYAEDLTFILETHIIDAFLKACSGNSLPKERKMYDTIVKRLQPKTLFLLRFLDSVFNRTTVSPIMCRMNLMKIKNTQDYIRFTGRLNDTAKMRPLATMLTLLEDI